MGVTTGVSRRGMGGLVAAVDVEGLPLYRGLIGVGVLLVEFSAQLSFLLASEDAVVVPASVRIPASESEEVRVLLLHSLLILLPPPPHRLIGEGPLLGDVLDGRGGRRSGELLEESGPVDAGFPIGVVRTPQPCYVTWYGEL